MTESKVIERLVCVCGKSLLLQGRDPVAVAARHGWHFYANYVDPKGYGTNALCKGCRNDGDDTGDE